MSQCVDERREHRPQAQSTSNYSVALLIPLIGQEARAGLSVLQPRCGMVTLLESAWPCARRVLVSEAVSFRTILILLLIDTAGCCRACSSPDTIPAVSLPLAHVDPVEPGASPARFYSAEPSVHVGLGVRRELWLPCAGCRRTWRGSFRRPHGVTAFGPRAILPLSVW